jgi:hypothetical protein
MDISSLTSRTASAISDYRVHIFVFLITLFIGLTLAHPAVLLNDEFITTNQLRQLHEGHQVIINEGNYGLAENGSMSSYFAWRSNKLVYSLILPLSALPARWMLDITGEHDAYLVIYLWTMTAMLIILFINRFFPAFSFLRQWRWTPAAIISIFIFFFINLYFYAVFPVDTINSYPEVIAIVFTNLIFLAVAATIIYETSRTIFEDPTYSFFATVVCLFSSSYFVWSTHCKDHILVLLLFSGIVLCLIRFVKTDDYWYLPLSFLITGLLAWTRPELALWTFLLVCCIYCYILLQHISQKRSLRELLVVLCSPLFTILGAMPFFLNNLMVTRNILLPVQSVYFSDVSVPVVTNTSSAIIRQAGVKSIQSLILMFMPTIPSSPLEFVSDLFSVFFCPQTGSISVFALVPLFLVMVIVAGIFIRCEIISFSSQEKKFMGITALVSLTVFLTYASQIHLLNVDPGIVPDIRYYLPMYLPLTLIGLIILKKIDLFQDNSMDALKKFFLVTVIGVPVSVILLSIVCSYNPVDLTKGIVPLGKLFSIYIISLIVVNIAAILYNKYYHHGNLVVQYMILLLCSVPFFWQVNETIVLNILSGFSKYTFWIPIIRVIYESVFTFILFKG